MAEISYTREIQLGNGQVFKTNVPDSLLTNLVMHLPLDWSKNNRIMDHSSNKLDGITEVNPSIVKVDDFPIDNGVVNKTVMYFNGSNDYINLNPVQDKIRDKSFTYSVWIKCDDFSGYKTLLGINSATGGNHYLALLNFAKNYGIYHTTSKDYFLVSPNSENTIIANQWRHVAVTYNKDTQVIETFIDAKSVGSIPLDSAIVIGDNARIQLGMEYDGSAKTDYFKGHVSQLSIFDKVLTLEEIKIIKSEDLKFILNKPPYPDFPQAIRENDKQQSVYNISDALEKILKLDGVKFKWKESYGGNLPSNYQIGLSQDELSAVFPELVDDNDVDNLTNALSALTPTLVEAVKQLQAEKKEKIQQLQNKHEQLKINYDVEIYQITRLFERKAGVVINGLVEEV